MPTATYSRNKNNILHFVLSAAVLADWPQIIINVVVLVLFLRSFSTSWGPSVSFRWPSTCFVLAMLSAFFRSFDMADPYSFSNGEYLAHSIVLSGNSEQLPARQPMTSATSFQQRQRTTRWYWVSVYVVVFL